MAGARKPRVRSGFSLTDTAVVGLKPDLHAGPPESSPRERVWQVVAAIPAGRVATYGQVAQLAGVPRGARFVGTVLRDLPRDSRLPWHRVLNASGRLSVDPLTAGEQRDRLEAEGVAFIGGRVSLSRFRW
jgi:methylated-DNA-protein-cysteine methyltransferase-like protein